MFFLSFGNTAEIEPVAKFYSRKKSSTFEESRILKTEDLVVRGPISDDSRWNRQIVIQVSLFLLSKAFFG